MLDATDAQARHAVGVFSNGRHVLLAGKVQRKVRNGVAQLAAARSPLDRQKFLQCRRCASMTKRPRKKPG
jgi:hypothetical protein